MKKVLVTGASGFIGSFVCNKLIDIGIKVHGIDNMNKYYDLRLKKARLEKLLNKKMPFSKIDLTNKDKVEEVFKDFKPPERNRRSVARATTTKSAAGA